MSPLWCDRLLLSLAPTAISWVRLTGVRNPAVQDKRTVAVEPGYGARAWDGALAALHAETDQWRNDRLSVRIVLSNHFVRYAVVPHSDVINTRTEELALARFQFSKVHGEISNSWDIRLSPARSEDPRLACAVDTALIGALRQSFPRECRPRLASVQPLLMSAFNSGGTSIPDSGAWLVMVEADRACVALFSGKTWHTVQNVKGQFADTEAWVGLVERERWRVNLDTVPDTLLVHVAQAASLPSRIHGTWKVTGLQPHWPTGLLSSRDGVYATALSAA